MKKININFIFSYSLFLVCMLLDFYATTLGSGGDILTEANPGARFIWEILGPYRFIEIPIWAIGVLLVTYLVNIKSRFLANFWLNALAFGHFIGFLTWQSYSFLNFLYMWSDSYRGIAIGLIGLFLGLLLAIFQKYLEAKR